ncbi:Heat shock protein DnaJ, cysteine-rich domain containing protein [Quillaja saponaria]|uniref:Heat shock protein DnaJ, cysteine-rich domain containing protein n=1 Tax=Quillaja saponaria TaxID=32244 RepID=A0AAD7QCC7_QUISA|nr:Heat shock protein DnaJ, cysteine-rich domain containing protein [Quillaja saponaria]
MAHCLGCTPVCSLQSSKKPGIVIGSSVAGKVFKINEAFQNSEAQKFQTLVVKATENNKGTKPSSIVCSNCEGNGAILCSQCKGTGVNSVDHFNGQFKAGGLCWLCRGKRDILCGDCNGAGFIGGFMSTFDA